MIAKEKTGLEKEAFDWAVKGVFDLMFPESQKEAAAKGYMGGVLAERERCAILVDDMQGDSTTVIAMFIRDPSLKNEDFEL